MSFNFRPIKISDKKSIENILIKKHCEFTEMCFANMFLWQKRFSTCFDIIDDTLYIKTGSGSDSHFMLPVGGDTEKNINKLISFTKNNHIPLNIFSVSPADRVQLDLLFPSRFTFTERRNSFCYVYDTAELAELTGKKWHQKRNHVNKFNNLYPEHEYKNIDNLNINDCKILLGRWFQEKEMEDGDKDAVMTALEHYNALGFEGMILYINGGKLPIAMTMATKLNSDTYDIHFEKALKDYSGAYAAINQKFAGYLSSKCIFINREEDMGIEGLRKSKLSYNPVRLNVKYTASLIK